MSMKLPAAVAALALMTAPAFAQDPQAAPVYGGVALNAGFEPDPHMVGVMGSGTIALNNDGSQCAGFVDTAPTYRLLYQADDYVLSIRATSSSDTVLLVSLPDGVMECVDDVDGLDPILDYADPQSGVYDIWVGGITAGARPQATIYIMEALFHGADDGYNDADGWSGYEGDDWDDGW